MKRERGGQGGGFSAGRGGEFRPRHVCESRFTHCSQICTRDSFHLRDGREITGGWQQMPDLEKSQISFAKRTAWGGPICKRIFAEDFLDKNFCCVQRNPANSSSLHIVTTTVPLHVFQPSF